MKLRASEFPFSKSQTRRKSSKLTPLTALAFLLTIILPIYYLFYYKSLSSQIGYQHQDDAIKSTDPPPEPNNHTWRRNRIHGGHTSPANPSRKPDERESPGQARWRPESAMRWEKKCDLFNGEWIPNPEGPYYTNETCNAIQDHQNCMKYGRPDTDFLKWRWKPDECELPVFDPVRFLEMVRGKSILFVGDSVARNHMQSLICLLSRVAQPLDEDASNVTSQNRLFQYTDYNFNISIVFSPYLIRTQKSDPNDSTRPFYLYLDEFDLTWTSKLEESDYVIISGGQWFLRPTYFYLNLTLAGCVSCPEPNVTHLPWSFSYRWALRTAFRAVNTAAGFRGVAFVRTYAPSHFEGGPWNKGGDCKRRRPFMRNETALSVDIGLELYRIQLEEVRSVEEAGKGSGGSLWRLFDATKPMMLRADGHPSKYGRLWPGQKQSSWNDCVHWCLPGPIDAWNDFLQELLNREFNGYYRKFIH